MKNLIIGISLLFNVLLIIYYINYKGLRRDYQTNRSVLEEKEAQISTVMTENGRLKQEKRAAVIDARVARNALKYYEEEVKDLEENHNVKIKNIHSYYRSRISSFGSGTGQVGDTVIITKDSIEKVYPTVRIKDNYLSLAGYFTEKSKFDYRYSVTDSISVAYYWTEKGMWPFRSNDKLMISFSSRNPNTYIENISSFAVVDNKKARFSIGPYVGYGISAGGTPSVQVGIGLQWSLIRF